MSQGWCAKGIEKEKLRRIKRHGNTFKPLLSRNHSTFAEKQVALRAYQTLLRRDDEREKVPVVIAPIFGGTGLPDEGYDFDALLGHEVVKTFKGPKGKSSKGSMVVSATQVPTAKVWDRRCGFAGK